MQSFYDRNRKFEIPSNHRVLTRSKTTNIRSISSYVGNYTTPSRIPGFEKRSSESPVKYSKTNENSLDLKDTRENLVEQEFYNRLISAHHRVDELLKSRGLKSDEKEPIIETDHSLTFPRYGSFNSSAWSLRKSSRKKNDLVDTTKNCYANIILDKVSPNLSASLLYPPFMNEEKVNFSISSAVIEIEPDMISRNQSAIFTEQITPVTKINFSIKLPQCNAQSNFTQSLKKSAKWLHERSTASINFSSRTVSSPCTGYSENKEPLIIKKSFFLNRAKQLRTVFRQAEVSIQHCSFYKVSKRLENQENCVRLNLRLTERTPLNMTTSIIIIANARPLCICEYFAEPAKIIPLPEKLNSHQYRTRSDLPALHYTTQFNKEAQNEKRKISRLQIPEQFLNITKENNNCPQLIGGFIYDYDATRKPKSRFNQPASAGRVRSERSKQADQAVQEKLGTRKKDAVLSTANMSLSIEMELKTFPKTLIAIDQPTQEDFVREHPVLRRTSQNNRQSTKDSRTFDIPIRLRKVDHSIIRPHIVFKSHTKWVPSWRKQRSCAHE